MEKDLTKGKPFKLILSFCLPLMMGQIFQQLYNMVDSIIVGRFAGTAELSAVGSTGSLSFMVIGFVTGFATGITIPLSQAFGEGNQKKLKGYFANCIYLSIVFSLFLTALSYCLTKPMLRMMNTPDDIFNMAFDYIGTVFLGITATMFYNLFACVMRALGDSKTPLLLLIFSSLLNIGLDLYFVIVLKMACKGVAIATVIAQALSAILGAFIILKKYKIIHFNRESGKFSLKFCLFILKIGLPMALQISVTAIGAIMLQTAVNSLGSNVIAAVTIAGKVQLFLVLPSESFGLTMATFCGQNIGAKKMDRVKRGLYDVFIMSMVYTAFAMLLAYFFGQKLGTLFVSSDQTQVLTLVGQFLRVCCKLYPVLTVLFILRNSVQGMGYSLPAMLAGVFELFARGMMSLFVIPKFGFSAVCFTNPSAWIAADILLIPVFIFSYKKSKIHSKEIVK